MSVGILSIIALVVTIAIGIKTKLNCGIVAVIFAFIIGQFFMDMKLSEIYSRGWPIGTFFMMMAIMFLFGIAQINGTLNMIDKKITLLLRGKNKLIWTRINQ